MELANKATLACRKCGAHIEVSLTWEWTLSARENTEPVNGSESRAYWQLLVRGSSSEFPHGCFPYEEESQS